MHFQLLASLPLLIPWVPSPLSQEEVEDIGQFHKEHGITWDQSKDAKCAVEWGVREK